MNYTTLTELYGLLYSEIYGDPAQTQALREVFEELNRESAPKKGKKRKTAEIASIREDVEGLLKDVTIKTVYGENVSAIDYLISGGNPCLMYIPGETTYLNRSKVNEILNQGSPTKAQFFHSTKSGVWSFMDRRTGEEIDIFKYLELDREYTSTLIKKGRNAVGEHPAVMNFAKDTTYYICGVKDQQYKCIILETNKDGLAYKLSLSNRSPTIAASIKGMEPNCS